MKSEEKLIELILAMVKRPAMYQTEKVEDIALVCFGFKYGTISTDSVGDFLVGFRKYVNKKFKSKSDHSWERLIRFYSGGDKHSIELFGKLFNEYLKLR